MSNVDERNGDERNGDERNGYEEAKARRNWLERLGARIPGFGGFKDRELRRDVDRLQREYLAAEIGGTKRRLQEKARAYADAGQIAALTPFDRLDRRLDGLAQAVRFADYGATGFFDAVKVYDEELDRLYQFDLSLLDELAVLDADVAAVPSPGAGDPAPAVEAAARRTAALEEKWNDRKQVLGGVVRTS